MKNISNTELLFDRQESFNDVVSCLVAKSQGVEGCEERLEGNLNIINTINEECKKRGFDPAQYQGLDKEGELDDAVERNKEFESSQIV